MQTLKFYLSATEFQVLEEPPWAYKDIYFSKITEWTIEKSIINNIEVNAKIIYLVKSCLTLNQNNCEVGYILSKIEIDLILMTIHDFLIEKVGLNYNFSETEEKDGKIYTFTWDKEIVIE